MTMPTQACQHLSATPQLRVLHVLDSHVHITDGFVQCQLCKACYLIELVDMTSTTCVFRVSRVAETAVANTIASLQKGSCDIRRAGDEVFNLTTMAIELDILLIMQNGQFQNTMARPNHFQPEQRSWRQLPCDGRLVKQLLLQAKPL
jgi:hypothetical protein